MLLLQAVQQYSPMHRVFWIFGIIGTVGAVFSCATALVKWMNGVYRTGKEAITHLSTIPTVAQTIAAVANDVSTIQTNHLSHMQRDMEDQTTLLRSIDKGISILVDRSK